MVSGLGSFWNQHHDGADVGCLSHPGRGSQALQVLSVVTSAEAPGGATMEKAIRMVGSAPQGATSCPTVGSQ